MRLPQRPPHFLRQRHCRKVLNLLKAKVKLKQRQDQYKADFVDDRATEGASPSRARNKNVEVALNNGRADEVDLLGREVEKQSSTVDTSSRSRTATASPSKTKKSASIDTAASSSSKSRPGTPQRATSRGSTQVTPGSSTAQDRQQYQKSRQQAVVAGCPCPFGYISAALAASISHSRHANPKVRLTYIKDGSGLIFGASRKRQRHGAAKSTIYASPQRSAC